MARIVSLLLVLAIVSPVLAVSTQEQRHQGNLAYSEYIRSKVEALPKNAPVEVMLKDGTVLKGTFRNYISFDDSVWVQPLNDKSIFHTEAYDISAIYDIVLITVEPI